MLRLKDITKNYKVAGGEIKVLKGLNVSFRKSEFVSILGPSGCGKTTTLNIVGGLDKYTSGDLIIAGKSTKNFSDRDWDIYRNRRIGFIFQSYNLIPHQTVLGNVELALTISGVSKEERQQRALDALEKVGLKGEEYKRPNQLSGGQCQRVAIARALVNEPDILLADEPTGALDSKTSVQIMDLIKEISKDKLVIMVTHNGDIAEQYSTRIIRLVDGEIVEDTNPFNEEDEIEEAEVVRKTEKHKVSKAKMSWWTAFKLSLRNLFTKRGRTIMTSIAGSIGIIGISAVLAVSTGVRGFIANMQDDMLSGNPITIQEKAYDLDAMMNGMEIDDTVEMLKEKGYVNVESMLAFLAEKLDEVNSMVVENDIREEYVKYVQAMPKEYGTVKIDRGIDVTNNIYTDFSVDGTKDKTTNLSISAIKQTYTSVMKDTSVGDSASMINSLGKVYMQAINNEEYILSQYDLNEGGRVAKEKNEIMIVVNNDWALTDVMLAQLGYYNQDEFINIALKATNDQENYNPDIAEREKFSYEELMGKKFVWYDNDTVFTKNGEDKIAKGNPFTYSAQSKEEWNGLELKVVGILTPKENLNYGCLDAGFYYTEALADYALQVNGESEIVKYFTDDVKAFEVMVKQLNNGMMATQGTYVDYEYTYYPFDHNKTGEGVRNATWYVGSADAMSSIVGAIGGGAGLMGDILILTSRELGGETVSNDISIYPLDFETKDLVLEYLDAWNDSDQPIVVDGVSYEKADRVEIKYTDTLSLIISMINTMIDVVTYALIAFTSLALVVSCVMIAIITYVSVVERVKEIGVIRSLGGRKKDVSNLFNAETLIIGLTSGAIGIGFTYLLSFIVNIIVRNAAGFAIMNLTFGSAMIMMLLSVGLTVLSGIIPSKKAAKQDPVVALRTE